MFHQNYYKTNTDSNRYAKAQNKMRWRIYGGYVIVPQKIIVLQIV